MIQPSETSEFIDEGQINQILSETKECDSHRVRNVLQKARELNGLTLEEAAVLFSINSSELTEELFDTAKYAKTEIYGSRIVFFTPLYISNLCFNNCAYCAFRSTNTDMKRRALSMEEIAHEVQLIIDQGHKRILIVSGESYGTSGLQYVLDAIKTAYSVKSNGGEIRRINVNIAPLTVPEFEELKKTEIGTFQIFQETYHRETYRSVHLGGRKRDYDWRVTAVDRAMAAGISDCGIGPLLGLYDWRFELLAMLMHIRHLENLFGVGPHTISVPRIEPALGSALATAPPHKVSDDDFRKIIAILRLTVPYTGIILSTRETPIMRRDALNFGVSQISAGSRVNPGGYEENEQFDTAQFALGDHRCLEEVILDVIRLGYIPSFCTGCYRMGRVGKDFMDLAYPGDIKAHCDPNGLSTFMEYLLDYASETTRKEGEELIEKILAGQTDENRTRSISLLDQVRAGKRDVYC